MPLTILEIILCILLFALLVTSIFRKLRLSIILGYLLAGALVGPNGLALAHSSDYVQSLAEFGIVFLMFTVGLEFSLPQLFALRYPVFVIGSLQVILTILFTTIMGLFLGMPTLPALAVGSIVAMSSTAIVVKQLNDQSELHSPHGLNAVGILLFQDLAVIPIIILIASLASSHHRSLQSILLLALAKGIVAILLIFLVGRWLLRPLFLVISKTRTVELFTLTVLLVTLTGAWLTNLFGLSYAFGAFLAGLMLAETEFRHQIEVEIRPFRDILLGLFFMSIGMLADVRTWYLTWPWITLLVIALTAGKMAIITLLSRFSSHDLPTATRTGIVLAQGGEFGFAILTLALTHAILPPDYGQVVLAALLISIALSPILIRFNKKISTLFYSSKAIALEKPCQEKMSLITKKLHQHIIICGYGRVGQHIARVLDKVKFPYVCLDLDSSLVRYASMAGENVIYGDPSHPGILNAVGLNQAKAIVISFNDLRSTIVILNMLNKSHPNLPKLVRCTDEFELKQLKNCGATHVIAELFETSLAFSDYLLRLIDIPASNISQLMEDVRSQGYDLLQRVFTGSQITTMADDNLTLHKQLKPILLIKGAHGIGKKIRMLHLKSTGVELISVRRGKRKFLKLLHSNIKLKQDDILVVYGLPAEIEKAEKQILG
ncbi:MAG: kefC 1 [Gammaproteobacteria bacterium]|jgi:CPA2 family monovalent cation:H+ antiporter-2|nr:kefC 1 [Gammaproteobacteria bacterium]